MFNIKFVHLHTVCHQKVRLVAVRTMLQSSNNKIDLVYFPMVVLELVLTKYFLFQETFYVQRRGTDLGVNLAPFYSNCYMANFEDNLIYYEEPFINYVTVWKIYVWYILHMVGLTGHPILVHLPQYDVPELQTMVHCDQENITFWIAWSLRIYSVCRVSTDL